MNVRGNDANLMSIFISLHQHHISPNTSSATSTSSRYALKAVPFFSPSARSRNSPEAPRKAAATAARAATTNSSNNSNKSNNSNNSNHSNSSNKSNSSNNSKKSPFISTSSLQKYKFPSYLQVPFINTSSPHKYKLGRGGVFLSEVKARPEETLSAPA